MPPLTVCNTMPPLFSYTLLSGPHPTAHPLFLFKKRTEFIYQSSPGIEKDKGFQLSPPSKVLYIFSLNPLPRPMTHPMLFETKKMSSHSISSDPNSTSSHVTPLFSVWYTVP